MESRTKRTGTFSKVWKAVLNAPVRLVKYAEPY